MNAGLIPLAIAAIGVAYGTLILRGPKRRDNVVFGILSLTDAAVTAWRGLNVLAGGSIISSGVLVPCTLGTIVLAILTLEFVTAFPRRRPMSWWWRAPLLAWGAAALLLAARETGGPWERTSQVELWFFGPATSLVFVLGARSFLRTQRRDARIVIGALWFRWAWGFATYFFAPLLGPRAFEILVWGEATVATTICFVVIGTAVLRSELFSIRSSAAEAVTLATLALLVILGGGGAVALALTYAPVGRVQQLALFGATLVPLALTAMGHALYPRVERRVLAGLDDRRARRLGVQGDPLPAEASEATAEAVRRIASIGDGAAVRWVPAAQLPDDVARDEQLRAGEPRRRDERGPLPAAMVVPALGADSALVGAFYLDGGLIDRDTYLVARELAARVALAVERADAVSALGDARRLAALGQFAAAIAHDIRTPLTSISLNVQILRRKLLLPDDDREHLDIALEELARLDRSVAEILDFAKPVRLAVESIAVSELLDSVTRALAPVLAEKRIAVRVEAGADAFTVRGDPTRLRQVLTNLVGNAAEASPPGAEVLLRALASDRDHVAIEVEDHGRGIAATDLPRIFEPFFTTRPDGTGLGLAICHKVVTAHGGDLRVRSAPDEGTTFTVLLRGTVTERYPATG